MLKINVLVLFTIKLSQGLPHFNDITYGITLHGNEVIFKFTIKLEQMPHLKLTQRNKTALNAHIH